KSEAPPAGGTAPGIVVMLEEDEAGEVTEKDAAKGAPSKTASSTMSPAATATSFSDSADTAALPAELKGLKRKLDTKEKENEALMKALEGSVHPEDDTGAMAGYMPGELTGDLEGRVVELQQQADDFQARLLEKDAALKEREAELQAEIEKQKKE